MPVNLSIKNAPDELVERLRKRAAANHRSLQGEMMSIMEEAVQPTKLTPSELFQLIRDSGLRTEDDGTAIIRADRDRDDNF